MPPTPNPAPNAHSLFRASIDPIAVRCAPFAIAPLVLLALVVREALALP